MHKPVPASPSAAPLRNILLLTATVRPPEGARNLARIDPQLRLADYLAGFEFYLDSLRAGAADAMVFYENSGFDITCFGAMARKHGLQERVECMSRFGLDYPPQYGRGYGEFRLIDRAMKASALIAEAGERAAIWKITGRYRVRNIAALVHSWPADADLYCHAHDWPRSYVDLYLMAWTRKGHEEIVRGAYRHLRQDETSKSPELRFREYIESRSFGARVVRRFRHVPLVDGVRAGDNRDFSDLRGKYLVRAFAMRWLPSAWI